MKRPRAPTLERVKGAKRASQSFTTPLEGSIYVVLWKTRYYAVIVLPLGDFGSIGLTGSIWETGLWKDCPGGYSCNEDSRIIYKNQNYEANGRFQQYPVKYFGRTPAPAWYGWTEAEQFKPFKNLYDGKLVNNYFVAMQFSARRETSQSYTRAAIESKRSTTQAASMSETCDDPMDADPKSERHSEVDCDDDGNDDGDDGSDAGDSSYETEDESSAAEDDHAPLENVYKPQAKKRPKRGSAVCPTRRRRDAGTAATVKSQASHSDAKVTDRRSQICIASGPGEGPCNQLGSVGVNVEFRDTQSARFEASKATRWYVSGGTRRAPYAVMSASIHHSPNVSRTPADIRSTLRPRFDQKTPQSNCNSDDTESKSLQFSIADIPGNAGAVTGVTVSTSSPSTSRHEIQSHPISKASRNLELSISPTATTGLGARPINNREPTVAVKLCYAEPLNYNQQLREAQTRKSRAPQAIITEHTSRISNMEWQAAVSEDLLSALAIHADSLRGGTRCCNEDMPGLGLLERLGQWRSNGDLEKILK